MTLSSAGLKSAAADVETPNCPRCKFPDARFVHEGEDRLYGVQFVATVVECLRCGLWYQRPRLPRERHGELYPAEYGPHSGGQSGRPRIHPSTLSYLARERGYSHLARPKGRSVWSVASPFLDPLIRWRVGVALIPEYRPSGRVLDVGCGHGEMLRVLRVLGWRDLHGIETDAEAAARARDTGADVRDGPVEDVLPQYPDHHFDAVIASMVVEHLAEPYPVVRLISRKLKPGGELLLSTISRDSVDAAFFGRYWAGFDFPRHMVYFRREDIEVLLAEELEEPEWFPQVAPIDWVRSAMWRGSWADRILASAGARAWIVPCAVFALLGRSGRISLRARRGPNRKASVASGGPAEHV